MNDQIADSSPKRNRGWVLAPVLIFAGLAAVFMTGLKSGVNPRGNSALINKPVPTFELPPLEGLKVNVSEISQNLVYNG